MSNEPRASVRNALVAAAALAVIVAGAVWMGREPAPAPALDAAVAAPPTVAQVADAAKPAPPPAPTEVVKSDELDQDETVSELLDSFGLDAATVHDAVDSLKGVYDFRDARPGATCEVHLEPDTGRLLSMRFEAGPLDVFEVHRDPKGDLVGKRVDIPVEIREQEVGATIEGSLWATMQNAGEAPALVALIVDVFAWDLDFFKDQHPGDQFRVVVQKVYSGDKFIRYGRILAAEYAGKAGTFRVFWFQTDPKDDKTGNYFLEDGQSARKTFLATPLKYVRISSGFSMARKHPILGYTRAHMGVDYAAPVGTPVWAMADGKVTWAGRKGPNGNLVVIEHPGGLTSLYAHLHHIARGIKPGVHVTQKRLIGAVGTTGLSTGPHLHFAVKRNGAYVNPRKLKMTRGESVAKAQRDAFKAMVARRLDRLRAVAIAAPQEATAAAPASEAGAPN